MIIKKLKQKPEPQAYWECWNYQAKNKKRKKEKKERRKEGREERNFSRKWTSYKNNECYRILRGENSK